jgi:3-dehydrosphinganine reductase
MDLSGKLAIVTGGSSGIGRATAIRLAQEGCRVWLVARRPHALEQALAEVRQAGSIDPAAHGMAPADIAIAEQAFAAVDAVRRAAGEADLLVNCAGIAHPGYFQDLDLAIFRQTMDVNYLGTVHMAKAVVPGMIARRSGHIVNLASAAGFLGVFGYTAYSASKYAVRGFSEVLRAEMRPHGVGVSVVFPPDVDTPQLAYEDQFKPWETRAISSAGKVMSPDVVAEAIVAGVHRNRFAITPGLEAKVTYRLAGLLGDWVHPILDRMVEQARRRNSASSRDTV